MQQYTKQKEPVNTGSFNKIKMLITLWELLSAKYF